MNENLVLPQKQRTIQNYLLIWLISDASELDIDFENTLKQIRSIINEAYIFHDANQCVDFLTDIEEVQILMIVPGTSSKHLIPCIHHIPLLNSIYILCGTISEHEEWIKQWPKIKNVHTHIAFIYESLQKVTEQYDQDLFPISIIPISTDGINSQNVNQLEPTFMYTQILKEILLGMDYNEQSIKDFAKYCRTENYGSPTNIDKFENEYCSTNAIWWYTYPSFLYSMINRALRVMEADTVIKMGFFLHDLHYQIQSLYKNQFNHDHTEPLIVYRGQGLSMMDFEKLLNTGGGLISFNNFLSTSEDRDVAVGFVQIALTDPELAGIVFKITIDSSISSTPFAAVNEVSYYNKENEVIFSMHSIFRIEKMTMIDNNNRYYEVELRLTTDEDPELRALAKHIQKDLNRKTAWEQLGELLVSIGQHKKAEDFFKVLLEQAFSDEKKALFYNQLGYISDHLGDYGKALLYCQTSLEIKEKNLPTSLPVLATSYNNIGEVYRKLGEYEKAISCYKKAIDLDENSTHSNDSSLVSAYNNLGLLYSEAAEYSKAFSLLKKALEIRQRTLPSNHPVLASSYSTLAVLYERMGEYNKALVFHTEAFNIERKSLPVNHPSLIGTNNDMARMHMMIGDYPKALSCYKKAIEICQETLPPNHPSLSTCFCNIATVYKEMGDSYSASSFYEKAIEIGEKYLPQNCPDLGSIYHNIAELYANMKDYSKALSFYEKAIRIYQKTFPSNHPLLATTYNNIARIYQHVGVNSKALLFFEKSLEIRQQTLSSHHIDLAQSYNNIARLYYDQGNYEKALSLLERALDICKRTLPENHLHIRHIRTGIEMAKQKLNEKR